MNTKDKIFAGIAIVIVAACSWFAIHHYVTVQKLVNKITSEESESGVIHYDNAADYYLDWFFKIEKGFKETELPYILGRDNLDNYTVDADSTVQRKIDEALWGYCLRTSDLFGAMCSYMNGKRDYDDRMFDVLATIINSQETYVNKYGSDLLKTDAKHNTFGYEEECLTKVVDNTFHKSTRILDHLKQINK